MARDALALAARGFRVFPLIPGTKRPAIERWQELATTNPEIIAKAWESREWNIGVACGGGVVGLDVDVKDGKPGMASLLALDLPFDAMNTFTVRTWSGGLHAYFRADTDVTNSAGRLGAGLDVRGAGGFLVGPGSVIEGKPYVIENDGPLAPAPLELMSRLQAPLKRETQLPLVDLDDASALARGADYLRRSPGAVEGERGDETTFKIAARLKDFGLSELATVELMTLHWNERCSPPWEQEDLEKKVASAYRSGSRAPGAAHPAVEFKGVAPVLVAAPQPAPGAALWMRPVRWIPAAERPARDFIYGDVFVRKYLTVTSSNGGVGKTQIVIAECLAVATGRAILGVKPKQRGRVWIWNGEDPYEELERRVLAAMDAYGITFEEVAGWLWLGSGRDLGIDLGSQKIGTAQLNRETSDAMVREIKKRKIDVVVLDPLISLHSVSENDNGSMAKIGGVLAEVADQANCAVHAVHHNRKTGGREATAEDTRGGGALVGATRLTRVVNPMSEFDARHFGIPADRRKCYSQVKSDKANMSESGVYYWVSLVIHHVANGDKVAVAYPWEPPKVEAAFTADDVRQVQAALDDAAASGSDCRRKHVLAEGWVGHLIAPLLALDSGSDRERLKDLIDAWSKSGWLKIERPRVNGKGVPVIATGLRPPMDDQGGSDAPEV